MHPAMAGEDVPPLYVLFQIFFSNCKQAEAGVGKGGRGG
jgi:hypothetical protein